jgi:hypothetical protein
MIRFLGKREPPRRAFHPFQDLPQLGGFSRPRDQGAPAHVDL